MAALVCHSGAGKQGRLIEHLLLYTLTLVFQFNCQSTNIPLENETHSTIYHEHSTKNLFQLKLMKTAYGVLCSIQTKTECVFQLKALYMRTHVYFLEVRVAKNKLVSSSYKYSSKYY